MRGLLVGLCSNFAWLTLQAEYVQAVQQRYTNNSDRPNNNVVYSNPEVDSRQNYLRVHTSNLTEFVSASVTQHFCSVILKSLDLRHVNDDSNTN